jgi:hypothetical protein
VYTKGDCSTSIAIVLVALSLYKHILTQRCNDTHLYVYIYIYMYIYDILKCINDMLQCLIWHAVVCVSEISIVTPSLFAYIQHVNKQSSKVYTQTAQCAHSNKDTTMCN